MQRMPPVPLVIFAIAAIALCAYQFVYLPNAISRATEQAVVHAQFAGNSHVTRAEIEQLTESVILAGEVNRLTAIAVADRIAAIPGLTFEAMQVIALTPDLSKLRPAPH